MGSVENSNVNNKSVSKTKIPVSKFRQTVEKVKAERRLSKEHESHIPVRRTSIPKQKKEKTVEKLNISKADDEFDKIYKEIVNTPTEINLDVLTPKVDDLDKIESTFEEIIHNYEEEVEVRKSKIPSLRNKQETREERTSKIIAARDKLRLRYSLNKSEELEKKLDQELQKTARNDNEVGNEDDQHKKTDDSNKNDKANATSTKTVTEVEHDVTWPQNKIDIKREETSIVFTKSDAENKEQSSLVETVENKATDTKIVDNKGTKQLLIEENLVKDSIKIGIPVFDSNTEDLSDNSHKVEAQATLSFTKSEDNVNNKEKHFKDHFTRQFDVIFRENKDAKGNKDTKVAEIKNIAEGNIEEVKNRNIDEDSNKEGNLKEEDIIQLRGKVERIRSKIDSKEVIVIDSNERESINELRMKKAVMSKIAIFEKADMPTPVKSKIPKKEIILPRSNEEKVEHIHTPLIVDEVFKFQSETSFSSDDNKGHSPLNKDGHTTFEVSKSLQYAVENNVQIELTSENYSQVKDLPKIEFNNTLNDTGVASITDDEAIKKEFSKTYQHLDANGELLAKKDSLENDDEDILINDSFRTGNNIDAVKETLNNNALTKEKEPLTPGYKTVSELLKSFEAKTPKRKILRELHAKDDTETSIDNRKGYHSKEFSTNEADAVNIENSRELYSFESINEYKSLDDVFTSDVDMKKLKLRQEDDFKRTKSLAELDLGHTKGKVSNVIRMMSVDRTDNRRQVKVNITLPKKMSVSEKIALFESKLTPSRSGSQILRVYKPERLLEFPRTERKIEDRKLTKFDRKDMDVKKEVATDVENDEERIKKVIEDLKSAKVRYGTVENMPVVELSNGMTIPAIAIGTATLDPRLIYYVVTAAIDLGYRAIDTAFIYGNEEQVGEAIRAKIDDGTVKREDLFIISKLWSTYHRTDLVEAACRDSLVRLGLKYVDLYLIHNPMSFKEGAGPFPKIATVLQYSEHDYLDAWYGMESLLAKGLVRAIGVSNFNSAQLQRVLDKGRVKPVVNQVECHPYLSQQRLDNFCAERNVTLSCFGVLGSKGTPLEYKNGAMAAIDDALVQVMASGLNMTPAQLLIRYQLENNRNVVVKSSTAAHLWDNLQALNVRLTSVEIDALNALNRNRRTFSFKGMGDTHKNYPFNIAF